MPSGPAMALRPAPQLRSPVQSANTLLTGRPDCDIFHNVKGIAGRPAPLRRRQPRGETMNHSELITTLIGFILGMLTAISLLKPGRHT